MGTVDTRGGEGRPYLQGEEEGEMRRRCFCYSVDKSLRLLSLYFDFFILFKNCAPCLLQSYSSRSLLVVLRRLVSGWKLDVSSFLFVFILIVIETLQLMFLFWAIIFPRTANKASANAHTVTQYLWHFAWHSLEQYPVLDICLITINLKDRDNDNDLFTKKIKRKCDCKTAGYSLPVINA